MRLFRSDTEFCTICRDDQEKDNYHRLECNHTFHFDCLFQMVFFGKIYNCPNCRLDFTENWVENYSVYIYNEADKLNKRNAVENVISYLRREVWNKNQSSWVAPEGHIPMDTPARNEPPEPFQEDAQGNWVVQLDEDEEINPLDALLESDMNIRPTTPPPELVPFRYTGPSLIPNRRIRRQQRIEYVFEDRDADDERRNSSQTSSE